MAYVERMEDDPLKFFTQDLRANLTELVPLVAARFGQEVAVPDITSSRDLAGDIIRQHGRDASPADLTRVALAARISLQNELQSLGEQ